jgi:hypothetical protein
MSHPPKYVSSLGDEEEAVGLLGADQVDATYPPTAAANAVSNGGLDETRSVVYHLRTDWPLKDEIPHQQSMSIIGKSRDVRPFCLPQLALAVYRFLLRPAGPFPLDRRPSSSCSKLFPTSRRSTRTDSSSTSPRTRVDRPRTTFCTMHAFRARPGRGSTKSPSCASASVPPPTSSNVVSLAVSLSLEAAR